MDTIEALKKRRSVRELSDKSIPKNILEELVDVGRLAATARNVQPWEFVVVTERGMLQKIAEIAETGRFIAGAGACIAVFCADTKYYLEDGCAATQNILVGAAGLGIGSCWVAGDKKPYCPQICQMLGVPATFKLISLIALGYPAQETGSAQISKRALKEVIHWEKF